MQGQLRAVQHVQRHEDVPAHGEVEESREGNLRAGLLAHLPQRQRAHTQLRHRDAEPARRLPEHIAHTFGGFTCGN